MFINDISLILTYKNQLLVIASMNCAERLQKAKIPVSVNSFLKIIIIYDFTSKKIFLNVHQKHPPPKTKSTKLRLLGIDTI